MGAKTSTITQNAGGNGQSSTGANDTTMQGFSTLRSLPGGVGMLQHQHQAANQSQSSRVSGDSRQRARSLSSVPDISAEQGALASAVGVGQVLGLPQLDADDLDEESSRVYAAHSLPSHIWSLNGKCRVQDIYYKYHLVTNGTCESTKSQLSIIANAPFDTAYLIYFKFAKKVYKAT